MKLPDVNVLVHASNPSAAQHAVAWQWLQTAGNSREGFGLTWVAMLGFVRLSTRAGIFASPLPVKGAMAILARWHAAPSATLLHPGPRHCDLLAELLLAAGTAGNLTTDAHLAAIAIEHGATLVSFDRDFERFVGMSFKLLK